MKDISTTIESNGKKYKLVFNLNVMELIQDEYGTIDKWGSLCEPGKTEDGKILEPNIKALKFGFLTMINEGIDIDNEKNSTSNPYLTAKQVGRLISNFGAENAVKALNDTVIESSKNLEKNGSSTKSQ